MQPVRINQISCTEILLQPDVVVEIVALWKKVSHVDYFDSDDD